MLRDVIAQTERLRLREIVPADLDDLAAMNADEEVGRYLGGGTIDRERSAAQLDALVGLYERRGWGMWAVERISDGAFLGRAGLLPQTLDDGEHIEMAYAYARAFWGQGFATEAADAIVALAFDRYDVSRLISIVHVDNVASQRVAQKAGLTFWRETTYRTFPVRVFARERAATAS
jgi:[ribosomal protein S5]-alanine N-acetyltransferase